MEILYTVKMKIYIICRQRHDKDKTDIGNIEYLTIDNGWSELKKYAAIFKKPHAEYITDKYHRSIKNYLAYFYSLEIKNG